MEIIFFGRLVVQKNLVFRIMAVLVMVMIVLPANSEIQKPQWWNNKIGKEEIVLPGFSPLKYLDQTIILGVERKYIWKNTFLPVEMFAKGKSLVTGTKLSLVIDGKEIELKPNILKFLKKTGYHAEIYGETVVDNKLKITVVIQVEYDGVAMVEVKLKPLQPIEIQNFSFETDVLKNLWTKMLIFKPNEIGNRTKHVLHKFKYNGPYLSAISVVDGEKSFWLFQDNAMGWLGDSEHSTIIREQKGYIHIQQNLISGKTPLVNDAVFKFNFLVTPVKEGNGNIRKHRVARSASLEEGINHGINLWWITAFSHQNLPYVTYPSGVGSLLPKKDKKAYPGLLKNRQILEKFKKYKIDKLPYFSAHTLNRNDPYYQKFRLLWEIKPEKVWRIKYDNPFVSKRDDYFLTHRAEGYTDYLLFRFSELIDKLGFEGLYFDQGGVMVSTNSENGLWFNSKGHKKGSTDILALREFHKRLATLLYLKGRKGLIFSHNSNSMIVPAYTFVTGMVQGEEFNHWLNNYDYIGSTSLDEVRSRLSGAAFGVPTIWMEVIYSEDNRLKRSSRPKKMKKKEWHASKEYENAYQNFMTLALLHDMPTWAFARLESRTAILKSVDWINPETADFVGYWTYPKNIFINNVFHSHYLSKDKKRILVILSNLNSMKQKINIGKLINLFTIGIENHSKCTWAFADIWKEKNKMNTVIESKRFKLIPFACK